MSDLGVIRYFTCGSVGGVMYVLASHPLDTIKVRLQAMPSPLKGQRPLYTGTFDCLRKTIIHEGVLGLYKGMGSALMMITPNYAAYFSGYGLGLKIFGSGEADRRSTYREIFCAGCFSPLIATFVVAPGERIKCLLQIQMKKGNILYKGPTDCIVKLYKEGGIKNLYRGFYSTLARDGLSTGVYFLIYEYLMDTLVNENPVTTDTLGTIISGGTAGAVYWTLGIPADVVKTMYQTAPMGKYKHGAWGIFVDLYRTRGVGALFNGLGVILLTAVPANSACFLGFEWCKRFLEYLFPTKTKE